MPPHGPSSRREHCARRHRRGRPLGQGESQRSGPSAPQETVGRGLPHAREVSHIRCSPGRSARATGREGERGVGSCAGGSACRTALGQCSTRPPRLGSSDAAPTGDRHQAGVSSTSTSSGASFSRRTSRRRAAPSSMWGWRHRTRTMVTPSPIRPSTGRSMSTRPSLASARPGMSRWTSSTSTRAFGSCTSSSSGSSAREQPNGRVRTHLLRRQRQARPHASSLLDQAVGSYSGRSFPLTPGRRGMPTSRPGCPGSVRTQFSPRFALEYALQALQPSGGVPPIDHVAQ